MEKELVDLFKQIEGNEEKLMNKLLDKNPDRIFKLKIIFNTHCLKKFSFFDVILIC